MFKQSPFPLEIQWWNISALVLGGVCFELTLCFWRCDSCINRFKGTMWHLHHSPQPFNITLACMFWHFAVGVKFHKRPDVWHAVVQKEMFDLFKYLIFYYCESIPQTSNCFVGKFDQQRITSQTVFCLTKNLEVPPQGCFQPVRQQMLPKGAADL